MDKKRKIYVNSLVLEIENQRKEEMKYCMGYCEIHKTYYNHGCSYCSALEWMRIPMFSLTRDGFERANELKKLADKICKDIYNTIGKTQHADKICYEIYRNIGWSVRIIRDTREHKKGTECVIVGMELDNIGGNLGMYDARFDDGSHECLMASEFDFTIKFIRNYK